MDTFEYKGRNKRGEVMQGTIESPNTQAVASWMLDSGIAPINIELHKDKKGRQPEWFLALQVGGAINIREKLLFTRQMCTMIKSGVPMMQALEGIQKSSVNPVLVDLLQDVRASLDKGVELSGALARHPKYFDDYYVSMVRVGEGTGQLEEVFKRLHEQLQFEKIIQQKIKGAMRYPMFVMIAIFIAIAIMALFVIPVFAKVYDKFHATLPFLTLALLAVSDFAVHYWWAVIIVIGFAIYAFKLYIKQPKGRYAWDKLKLKFPVVGGILNKATLARFCRSFATASKSGIPLVQAFTLVSRVVDNAFFEERILLMRDGVERGESMLRVAQSAGIFTPIELQMISVGEETGDIDGMLNQVADMYQEEVEYEVGRLSETIEPLLLAFMGVLILLMMLGIFVPMWDLGTVAFQKAH
jgi:MSHA biogenesis protein MshG